MEGNESFKCGVCEEEFPELADLEDHLSAEHARHETYGCGLCGESFTDQEALTDHLESCEVPSVGRGRPRKNKIDETKCDKCGKMFSDAKSLRKHVNWVHGNKKTVYECEHCGVEFLHMSKYQVHMQEHTGIDPCKCQTCGKMFSNTYTLRDHVMIHTGEKPHSCEVCGKGFIKAADLTTHRYSHVGDDERPFQCSLCNKGFSTKRLLLIHMHNHTGTKPFQCDLCGRGFNKKAHLVTHSLCHTDERAYTCPICAKTYKSKEYLRRHKTEVHNEERPFQCDQCGRRCKTKLNLDKHKKVHLEVKEFRCQLCPAMFSYADGLKIHTQKVHEKKMNFECVICGKMFFWKRHMTKHYETHKDRRLPKGNRPFQCQYCMAHRDTAQELKAHIVKEHPNGREFKCRWCDFRFPTRQGVTRHEVKHTRDFTCQECGKSFSTRCNLKRHFTQHPTTSRFLEAQLAVTDIRNEMNKFRQEDGLFHCTDCENSFSDGILLHQHMKDHRPFVCNKCGASFKLNVNLKSHMVSHSDVKPFVCNICSNAYKTNHALTRHKKDAHDIIAPNSEDSGGENPDHDPQAGIQKVVVSTKREYEYPQRSARQLYNYYGTTANSLQDMINSQSVDNSDAPALDSDNDDNDDSYNDSYHDNEDIVTQSYPTINLQQHVSISNGQLYQSGSSLTEQPYQNEGISQATMYHQSVAESSEQQFQNISISHGKISRGKVQRSSKKTGGKRSKKVRISSGKAQQSVSITLDKVNKSGARSSDKPYRCDMCNLSFRYMVSLERHRITAHGATPRNQTEQFFANEHKELMKTRYGGLDYLPTNPTRTLLVRKQQEKTTEINNLENQQNLSGNNSHPSPNKVTNAQKGGDNNKNVENIAFYPDNDNGGGGGSTDLNADDIFDTIEQAVRKENNQPTQNNAGKNVQKVPQGQTQATSGKVESQQNPVLNRKNEKQKNLGFVYVNFEREIKTVLVTKEVKSRYRPSQFIVKKEREDWAKCATCERLFSSQEELHAHLVEDMQNALLRCRICGFLCDTAKGLEEHKAVHGDVVEVKEEQDPDGFCYLNLFAQNGNDDGDESEEDMEVVGNETTVNADQNTGSEIQTVEFSNSNGFEITAVEDVENDSDLKAVLSGAAMNSSSQVTSSSQEKAQDNEMPYECYICEKSFATDIALGLHKMIHGEEGLFPEDGDTSGMSFECAQCHKTFPSPEIVKVHFRSVHAEKKQASAAVKSYYKNILEKMQPKVAVQPRGVSVLKVNMQPEVGVKSNNVSLLTGKKPIEVGVKSNIQSVQSEKKQTFKCPHCPKEFPSGVALNMHKMMHEDDKHDNNNVSKKIKRSSIEEVKVEVGMLLQCTMCDEAYPTWKELQAHEQSKHPTEVASETAPIAPKPIIIKPITNNTISAAKATSTTTSTTTSTPTVTLRRIIHKCYKCNKSFSNETLLRSHSLVEHFYRRKLGRPLRGEVRSPGPTKCDMCGKNFPSLDRLRYHVRAVHSKEKRYKCGMCGEGFVYKGQLDIHLRKHTGEDPHKCDTCGKSCVTKESLKSHMMLHTGVKPHECDVCGKGFYKSNDLKNHKWSHRPVSERPYKCSECSRGFLTKKNLEQHMRVHTGEKPFTCQTCGKAFARIHHLQVHMRFHTGTKNYKCGVCGKAYVVKGALTVHLRSHTNERPYTCDECGARFKSSQNLKVHKNVHNDIKPFHCEECGANFKLRSSLDYHMRRHRNDLRYQCEECHKAFVSRAKLNRHMKYHAPEKEFNCEVCGKGFISKPGLQAHMISHSDERPFACPKCEYTCKTERHLKFHMISHNEEKNYKCPLCSTMCKSRNTLHAHILIHNEGTPFSCQLCGKEFKLESYVHKHMKRVHPEFFDN